MRKKSRKILVALYILIILWITLFSRRPMESRIFRGLFWEIEMGYWGDIALNILIFVPLGFLIGRKGLKAVLTGFLISASIECAQYLFLLGFCEVDDVLNNTIGAAVGCGVWKLRTTFIEKWKNKRV